MRFSVDHQWCFARHENDAGRINVSQNIEMKVFGVWSMFVQYVYNPVIVQYSSGIVKNLAIVEN